MDDGDAIWIKGTRVSSEVLQNIKDGREWGYSDGLVVFADYVVVGMTWTDNRIVSAPWATLQRSVAGLVENAGKLAGFNGGESAGTCSLRVTDDAAGDLGRLDSWELRVCRSLPFGAVDDSYSVEQDGVLNVAAPGVLDNDMGSGVSATLLASGA